MATPKDPMAAMLAQVNAYRSKTPEQAAADKLRQGVAARVVAKGGTPTQARLDAIISKTAATKAAAAKAATAMPVKKIPVDAQGVPIRHFPVIDPSRGTGNSSGGVVLSGPTPEGLAAAEAVEKRMKEQRAAARRGGTPDAGDMKTPAGWTQGNKTGWNGAPLPPGRGEIGADGKPIKTPTSPFSGRSGRRGNRRRGNRMPVPRTRG
ncbi:MAG: hypothetical protein MUE61_08390 [Vicinamibacterales bacterium]|jgi:hypothetical protein|nr:hypothetical protein [Vicinamibacterales bacterium]MCU0477183.1 hypothetical protein [Chloroflexota bacterium]MCU0562330.1 hypothetical protein [Desulfobacterales bacterium]